MDLSFAECAPHITVTEPERPEEIKYFGVGVFYLQDEVFEKQAYNTRKEAETTALELLTMLTAAGIPAEVGMVGLDKDRNYKHCYCVVINNAGKVHKQSNHVGFDTTIQ